MSQIDESYKTFKDLSIEELVRGYSWSEEEQIYTCIFCGEIFEEGLIYSHESQLVVASKAAGYHVLNEHGGAFNAFLSMDKQIIGVSESQRAFMTHLYNKSDNKLICEDLGISSSTVRSYKFNLQKMKRQAKIFLALMETIENTGFETDKKKKSLVFKSETKIDKKEKPENLEKKGDGEQPKKLFSFNSLHPFFTQYRLK